MLVKYIQKGAALEVQASKDISAAWPGKVFKFDVNRPDDAYSAKLNIAYNNIHIAR